MNWDTFIFTLILAAFLTYVWGPLGFIVGMVAGLSIGELL